MIQLTVQETIVFEASPTEQSVEGVHGPLTRNALGLGPIYVWSTFLRTLWILMLRKLNVPQEGKNPCKI